MVKKREKTYVTYCSISFFLIAILNIIAWVLLASAGVMVARYFDSVWPDYERRVVVDGSGAVTGEKIQRRRRVSYFTVIELIEIFSHQFSLFHRHVDSTTSYVYCCNSIMDCILVYSF